jgi:dynein light chain 4
MAKYPLVAASDCAADMKAEAVDVCVSACERHQGDLERCTQVIKETMDKRFGGPWHVVVGKAFAFDVTHEVCCGNAERGGRGAVSPSAKLPAAKLERL